MTDLSVIIPAYNEADNIDRTVRSVVEHIPAERLAEVIVCDHGSSDATAEIARRAGASVHVWEDGTIAAQRNRGAARATGEILVFLDADTALTPEWAQGLPALLDAMARSATTVTGSHVLPPPNGTRLERLWFTPIARAADPKHLGSAHLILSRSHFEAIGGFDASLETGEDFELCVRAVANGSTIVNDSALVAIHHDFPKTLRAFVRREAWHGRGNFASWTMFRSSPVGLATVLFIGMHALAPTLGTWSLSPIAGIVGLCLASSLRKFRGHPATLVLHNGGVFYFYYWGRAGALLRRCLGR